MSGRRVEILVPVRNVWWVAMLARFYRTRGLAPLWVIDATSHPLFRLLARRHCRRRIAVRPAAPRAETMLAPALEGLDCAWVVRLDGDELPSEGLLAEIARLEAGADPGADCLACARDWARIGPGGRVEVSRNAIFGRGGQDHQYRIFRRATLEIDEAIHTPGFRVDPGRLAFLGRAARIWHLNWICYTEAERRAKIAAYDAQAPGAGSDFAAFYLPEEAPEGTHRWEPLPERAAAELAARIGRFRRSPPGRALARMGPP